MRLSLHIISYSKTSKLLSKHDKKGSLQLMVNK